MTDDEDLSEMISSDGSMHMEIDSRIFRKIHLDQLKG